MALFIASLALLAALFLSVRNLRFLLRGEAAVGRVHTYAGYEDETSGFAPTVTFESKDGQERVFTSLFGSAFRVYDTDQKVPVRYLDRSAEIEGFAELWLVPIILVSVSAFLFAIALN